MTPQSGRQNLLSLQAGPGRPHDPVTPGGLGSVIVRIRPDHDVTPALHPGCRERGASQTLELANRYSLRRDVAHEVGPHRQRHQPWPAPQAGTRSGSRRPVRHPPLGFVVELDRECDEYLREESVKGQAFHYEPDAPTIASCSEVVHAERRRPGAEEVAGTLERVVIAAGDQAGAGQRRGALVAANEHGEGAG